MADALIENPILNSPFLEPERHFKFTDEGITNRSSGPSIQLLQLTRPCSLRVVPGVFTESPDKMVRRVCREFGYPGEEDIVVLNDEAHHCYRRKPEAAEAEAGRRRIAKAEKRAEEARMWISGLEAIKAKIGIKGIYDLSATPFLSRKAQAIRRRRFSPGLSPTSL